MKFERGIGIIALVFCILIIGAFLAFSVYMVRLDNTVREKFEGNRWDIPAKVFARPLELKPQAAVSQDDLIQELNLLGYKKSDSYSSMGNYTLAGQNTIYIHTRGFNFGDLAPDEPEQVVKVSFSQNQIANVSTTNPTSNGVIRLEPILIGGIYPQHNEDRVLIKLDKVPKTLIEALIATEDRNFYNHYGLSIRGTARALVSNVTGGKRQGGSTLTQQLVKNFYLTPERTFKRKANEALMALLVDFHYSKDEILEAYLNEVNLGQNGNYSINGYGLASQFYFGLPLRELNIAQQAFLVGLVQGPSLYNPWRHPEKALKRRNIVLNNMLVMGYLTQEEYENEIARPLNVVQKPMLNTARFPDFLDVVRRQLRKEYEEADFTNQGLRIFTTLDPIAQTEVEKSFKSSVTRLINSNPKRLQELQGAVVVTEPNSGELLALVGSVKNFTGFNRAIDARRQVGSLLKPVIYLNALESGRYTWASLIQDRFIKIPLADGKSWSPKNYSGSEHGAVPMVQALENSYNLSAVRLGEEFGLTAFRNQLINFGVIAEDIPNYPSAFLGAVNLSPLRVAEMYGNFASGGQYNAVTAIRSVVNSNGAVLHRYGLEKRSSIPNDYAYILNYGLQQVMSAGTGRAAYNQLPRNLNLAGKSGTTNDTRDSWFAGYSGNHVTVVWLGLDNNAVTGLTGSSGALPVWTSVMNKLKQKPVNLTKPSNVQWHWIDTQTGKLSARDCSGALYIPISSRQVPRYATECAMSHYQVEPTYEQNPASSEPKPQSDDSIQNLIQESNNFDEGEVISQGSFSG